MKNIFYILVLTITLGFSAPAQTRQQDPEPIPVNFSILVTNDGTMPLWVTIYNTFSVVTDSFCLQPYGQKYLVGYWRQFYTALAEARPDPNCAGQTVDSSSKLFYLGDFKKHVSITYNSEYWTFTTRDMF